MTPTTRNTLLAGIAAVALTAATVAPAEASSDRAPADGLTTGSAIQALTAAGYADIRDIEFEDGVYEARVFTASGDCVKLSVDPLSGAVSEPTKGRSGLRAWFGKVAGGRDDEHRLPAGSLMAAEIARLVEADGLRLLELEAEDGRYEAKVVTIDGRRDKLHLDPLTGERLPRNGTDGR